MEALASVVEAEHQDDRKRVGLESGRGVTEKFGNFRDNLPSDLSRVWGDRNQINPALVALWADLDAMFIDWVITDQIALIEIGDFLLKLVKESGGGRVDESPDELTGQIAVTERSDRSAVRGEVVQDIDHAAEVVDVRVGEDDVFEPVDVPLLEELEKRGVGSVIHNEVAIDENPLVAWEAEEDRVSVATVEEVALAIDRSVRSGSRR